MAAAGFSTLLGRIKRESLNCFKIISYAGSAVVSKTGNAYNKTIHAYICPMHAYIFTQTNNNTGVCLQPASKTTIDISKIVPGRLSEEGEVKTYKAFLDVVVNEISHNFLFVMFLDESTKTHDYRDSTYDEKIMVWKMIEEEKKKRIEERR